MAIIIVRVDLKKIEQQNLIIHEVYKIIIIVNLYKKCGLKIVTVH